MKYSNEELEKAVKLCTTWEQVCVMVGAKPRIEEFDDTPSAFEIKICEMTSAVYHRDKSPYQANKVLFKGHAKALTQAYQAGIDEAVEMLHKLHLCSIGKYDGDELENVKAQIKEFQDTIKALQDNK